MNKVNFLERKLVIQLFGFALLVAPFFNTLIMMATHSEIPNRWSLLIFKQLLFSGPSSNLVLYFFSIIIGLLMLRGQVSAWKYVLVLLGANIALQVSHFEKVKSSQITTIFFVINSSLFLLVTYFFVWKQPVTAAPSRKQEPETLAEPVAAAIPTASPTVAEPQLESQPVVPPQSSAPPPILEAKKKIVFQFEGLSPWAELITVSKKGFHLRAIAAPPSDVTTKDVEITFRNGLILRGRLARQLDSDYFFEHQQLQGGEIRLLNEWLRACA